MMWQRLKQRWADNRLCARRTALITILLGLVLWRLPQGDVFVQWSFDLPTLLAPGKTPSNILIIQIDEPTLTELKQSYTHFNRTNHVNLLKKLTAAPARLVVFDIFFPDSDPHPEDGVFAEAIRANGRVVLAADYSPLPGHAAGMMSPPVEILRGAALSWGISRVERESNLAVRRLYSGSESRSSLPWSAAEAMGAPITQTLKERAQQPWLRYYGEGTLPSISYFEALLQSPAYFKDKIIFIGGKPATRDLQEEVDEFASPYTHWGGPLVSGVEVQATTFLNLLNHEWLRRMPGPAELALLALCGLGLSCGLCLARPLAGLGVAALIALSVGGVACLLFWYGKFWFSWLLIAGAQVPCAWVCVALSHTQRLYREKADLEGKLRGTHIVVPALPASPTGSTPALANPAGAPTLVGPVGVGGRLSPVVSQYTLLRRIGKGAYGEVYLARNAIGGYHAVKVVYREDFAQAGPYDREFRGIQKYMPVSLNHPGLVHLLHVGRNDEAGYFYYVMELGDGNSGGSEVDPEQYAPRNLSEDLEKRGRLSVDECLDLFLPLTEALDYLHRAKLIHRDIKPSNIIFVKGVPKFADIGLVTDEGGAGSEVSYVGTEGYIAPEGPGTAAADVYSLGIVLYQAATGLDRRRFPELPAILTQGESLHEFMPLNRIILKASQPDAAKRYPSAGEMRKDLLLLRASSPET